MANVQSDRSSVISLLQSCVVKLVEVLPKHIDSVGDLPPNLKDRIVNLMAKRGLITDDNIEQAVHAKLRVLDLSESEVSNASLQVLARRCHSLLKLDLNSSKGFRTEISSEGLVSLAQGCPSLQVVYVRRCTEVTDEAIVALSQHCSRLRHLNIGGCGEITDRTLQALGQNCQYLRSINFSYSQVTDEGVLSLVNGCCSESLKELHMTHCDRLTDGAVEAIVQFAPNVNILLFSSCPQMTDRSRVALEEIRSNTTMKQVTWTVY